MCPALSRSFCAPVAGSVGLLVALLVCAGPARADKSPSKEPTTQEYARQLEKDLKEAEDHDPTSRNIVRLFKSWVGLVVLALVVAPLVIGFKAAMWFVRKASAPTDPQQLALSDPWIREQLARQKVQGGAPPP